MVRRCTFALFVAGFMTFAMMSEPLVAQNAGSSWQPSKQQKSAAVALAEAHFAAVDRSSWSQAVGLMTPEVQYRTDPDALGESVAASRRRLGAVQERRIAGVTWYPTASREGAGVAAGIDFQARTENDGIACGDLSIIERTEGVFEILRVEQTEILRADAATMSKPALTRLLNRPGCRVFLQKSSG
ncbi:MAG: hypothetical protein AAGB15_00800 [Pseudomonadota bacterium]